TSPRHFRRFNTKNTRIPGLPTHTMRTAASLMLACAIACAQSDIRGFAASQVSAQREREAKAHSTPDPERLRSYMQRMSAEPHIAGSPASKAVAEYAAGLLREWGLEVRIEEFEALLPYPTSRLVEMTAPVKFTAKLQEPALAED